MIALAAVLASLQAPLDSGVFVVRQDTVEIARESFRLLPSPAGGFTLTATTLNRNPTTLRHVVVSGGADGAVHLWLTRDGRLLKVEIPARRVVAERAPGD